MLYGSETWAVKVDDVRRLSSAEKRMLRLMTGFKIEDRKRNEDIRSMLGVDSVENCLQRERLRWYGHVMRRPEEAEVRKAMDWKIEGEKKKGRAMKTWLETVRNDLRRKGIDDRHKWRRYLRRANSCKREKRP